MCKHVGEDRSLHQLTQVIFVHFPVNPQNPREKSACAGTKSGPQLTLLVSKGTSLGEKKNQDEFQLKIREEKKFQATFHEKNPPQLKIWGEKFSFFVFAPPKSWV